MADEEQQESHRLKEAPSKTVDFRGGGKITDSSTAGSVRYIAGRVRSIAQQKESAAQMVALIITWTFAVSAILILIGLYRIMRYMPGQAKDLIEGAAVPFIKEAGPFLSATFGPLLAFVLGYYFGEKRKEEEKKPE